ncbi:MAG: MarR family transcriptional regulator, partial [Sedimentisphaerales bacterium]|nr:MarR family transcriptional regulator [Sedimentisphaerales bacterium]
HRQTDARCGKRGVTADQFVLLALLGEEDGITQQQLVRRASSDANTVRAMLVLLERRGLIARDQHPTDGRARSVTLTPKGRLALKRLWRVSEPIREHIVAVLEPQETDVLVELLTHVSKAMTQTKGRTRSRSKAATAARA